jgi:hypothetical protein
MSAPMDKEVALDFFAAVLGGRHHVPTLKEWGFGWCITLYGHMSTYDSDRLTALVMLAHDRAMRVEISACNMQYIRLAVHQRSHAADRFYSRHPTLEQATAEWRKRNPAPEGATATPAEAPSTEAAL